jgi:hypothetical protein
MAPRLSYLSEQFPITLLCAPRRRSTQSPGLCLTLNHIYQFGEDESALWGYTLITFARTQPAHAETMHGALRLLVLAIYVGDRGEADETKLCLSLRTQGIVLTCSQARLQPAHTLKT